MPTPRERFDDFDIPQRMQAISHTDNHTHTDRPQGNTVKAFLNTKVTHCTIGHIFFNENVNKQTINSIYIYLVLFPV